MAFLANSKLINIFIASIMGGQLAAHAPRVVHWTVSGGALQLGKVFQMKNVPQLISRIYNLYVGKVKIGEFFPAMNFFFREQLDFSRKSKNLENLFQRWPFFLENSLVSLWNFEVFCLCGGYKLDLNKIGAWEQKGWPPLAQIKEF